MSDKRLLPVAQLPVCLWNKESRVLALPAMLSQAYVDRIKRLGLLNLGTTRTSDEGPIGGLDEAAANQHFAQRFDGSAARVILAILDPNQEVGSTSDHFIKSTAGANLALTDAPCGAGAAALAFLASLAELRLAGALPRMPLDVHFVGGEISPFAMAHARELFQAIQPKLAEQAIFIEPVFVNWDVMDEISTTDLIKTSLLYKAECVSKLLIVANFNGLLVKEKKQKEALPQLDELFRYASGERSLAVWIEPDMNRATRAGGLFPWLVSLFQKNWRGIGKPHTTGILEQPAFSSTAKFRLPLQPNAVSRVTLAVLPIELARSIP